MAVKVMCACNCVCTVVMVALHYQCGSDRCIRPFSVCSVCASFYFFSQHNFSTVSGPIFLKLPDVVLLAVETRYFWFSKCPKNWVRAETSIFSDFCDRFPIDALPFWSMKEIGNSKTNSLNRVGCSAFVLN